MRTQLTAQQQTEQRDRASSTSRAAAEAAAEAAAFAEIAAGRFSGVRVSRETDRADSSRPPTTVLYVSSVLLGLMSLGTFLVGSMIGWSFCKTVDACRTPNY